MTRANPHIYHLLQIAAHRLHNRADRQGVAVAGVTAARAGAMFVIAENPGTTQRGVAKALRQRESAVTTMVTRLVTAGLIRRQRSSEDPRAWSLYLTKKGETALREIKVELDRINKMLADAIGVRNIGVLATLLHKIVEIDFDEI